MGRGCLSLLAVNAWVQLYLSSNSKPCLLAPHAASLVCWAALQGGHLYPGLESLVPGTPEPILFSSLSLRGYRRQETRQRLKGEAETSAVRACLSEASMEGCCFGQCVSVPLSDLGARKGWAFFS